MVVLVLLLLWCALCSGTAGSDRPVVSDILSHIGAGTYFGYAVQLTNGADSGPRLLVGAPLTNSSTLRATGAVFSCDPRDSSTASCRRFLFDPNEGNVAGHVRAGNGSRHSYQHRRNGQWLGGTLDALGDSLLACAPRWANQYYLVDHRQLFLNGLCYWLPTGAFNTDRTARQLMPLLDIERQGHFAANSRFYHYGYGQAGLSCHITMDHELLLGAPGLMNWQGSVVRYRAAAGEEPRPPDVPNPLHLQADGELDFLSYLGYAVTSGVFSAGGARLYVAGAPRGRWLLGQVLVFSYTSAGELNVQYEAHGDEMGEYFGAAVACTDVTGDGLDDIVVGAPTYSGAGLRDTGRVYLLASDGRGGFKRQMLGPPNGGSVGARYGAAVAALGDLNADGYADVAMGAPYEDGHGAVYVHAGSPHGLLPSPLYRLTAEQLHPRLSGFGISISRGLDIDGNGVNDAAIGAHRSDQVVILRNRPRARINLRLTASVAGLPVGGAKLPSFQLIACLNHSEARTLPFAATIVSDPYYGRTEERTAERALSCRGGEGAVLCCVQLDVRVFNRDRIYTEPLEFRLTCEPACKAVGVPEYECPLLEAPSVAVLRVPYETNCGEDVICQPVLRLSGGWTMPDSSSTGLVLAADARAEVELKVQNGGEPAYLCTLDVWSNAPLLSMPDRCQQITPSHVQCQLGNPLGSGRAAYIALRLDLTQQGPGSLLVRANVSSIGSEVDRTDNSLSLRLPLTIENNVETSGFSEPDQQSFGGGVGGEENNTFIVVHRYEVRSAGPSRLDTLKLRLLVPHALQPGGHTFLTVLAVETHARGGELRCTSGGELSDRLEDEPERDEDNGLLSVLPAERTWNLECGATGISCLVWTCKATADLEAAAGLQHATLIVRLAVDVCTLETTRGRHDVLVLTSETHGAAPALRQLASTVLLGEMREKSAFIWVALGVAAGLLLLAVLTLLLYKLDFFKRADIKRLSDEKENFVEEKTEEDKC